MAEAKSASKTKVKATKKVKKEGDNGNLKDNRPAQNETDNQTAKTEVVATTKTKSTAEPKVTAKAGKRSAKAVKETEVKAAKEERKALIADTEEKPKPAPIKSRSRLDRQGKKFREIAKLIDKSKDYMLKEAVELAVKTSPTKFDATAEMHVRLGVDPRQADQNVRDMVVLPAGTGKSVRIAVLADGDQATAAKKAGADLVGLEDLLSKIEKEQLDFDVLIATPALMARLGKFARVLGPKGLMPNPKSGTVTNDLGQAVTEAKAGKIEYRVDSTGIVHVGFGKVSFGADKLQQNARVILDSIKAGKPNSLKGNYVLSIHVTTSMGPSIKVATSEA